MLRLMIGNHTHKRGYCPSCGHRLPSYILDGTNPAPVQPKTWLTMTEAAKVMDYSYSWLAHHWQSLGLHPTDYGPRRLFEAKEIEAFMQRNRVSYRGRPPKR